MDDRTVSASDPKPQAFPAEPALLANAIRALAMDAVEKAKSGHPGMPMGFADVATVLFTRILKFHASSPDWADRDRLILSAGHGSMLLYASFYLLGYPGMPLEELQRFRQLGSKTPGHPEYRHTKGVETTTGPLGQGFANGVGMALAERMLAAQFGADLVDHMTYVIASDGDLMEGISHEAASLAGHLKLSKLVVLFDDNGISIDGPLSLSESGDQLARFAALGWATTRVDGHDPVAIETALRAAKASDKPSLIACKTVIGRGAPTKQGTASSHGSPLGEKEIEGARAALGWTHPPFMVPPPVLEAWRAAGRAGAAAEAAWATRFAAADPGLRAEFTRRLEGRLPEALGPAIAKHIADLLETKPKMATRKASEAVLKAINAVTPEMVGGSADLSPSNNVKTPDQAEIAPGAYGGRYIHYGVREHGMAGAMNGMALHKGFLPYGGTFLVFSDYCRPSIRLAALMGLNVVYVMTHDSIGVGEDGPTHQPVEHLAALRAIPNLLVFRPADAVETAECWQAALEAKDRPSLIALTRQDLPALRVVPASENRCARGGYELLPATGKAEITLLATGSEVEIAAKARALLEAEGLGTRVVSMPCWALFEAMPASYRNATLGPGTIRLAIEAGIRQGWERYIGEHGIFVGMTGFGASAPSNELYSHFGITAEGLAAAARAALKARP
jgi:transketolase